MNLISSLSVKKLYIPISWCDLATFLFKTVLVYPSQRLLSTYSAMYVPCSAVL